MKPFIQTIRMNEIKYMRFLVFYIIAVSAAAVCEVLVSRSTGSIGQAAVALDSGSIIGLLITLTVITALQIIIGVVSNLASKRFSGRVGYAMRKNFIRHFTSISFSDISKKSSGDLLSLYTNDLPSGAMLITETAFQLVAGLATLIVSGIYMAILSPWMTLVFFAMFPPLVILQAVISQPIQKHIINASTKRGIFNAIVNDALQNTSAVIAYSLEDVLEERYMKSYKEYYDARIKYVKSLASLVISGIGVTFLPLIFVMIVSALAVVDGRMTLGDFIVAATVFGTANGWLSMLSQQLSWFQSQSAGAVRVNENMGDPFEEASGSKNKITIDKNAPAIEFKGIDFSYGDGKKALSGLSFSIASGSKVAIAGASGSGKSTVIKLILSLYEAESGRISVCGNDIKDMTKEQLREMIAYVPQDNFMFPDTIRENITCVRGECDDTRLEKACRDAGILDFIKSLPDGFDSVLSESGENVSGGQRQRIALARALYKDAPIVLFDEATSALDPVTEKAILDTFITSMQGKTAIVIAHRPSAISVCERVITMEGGILIDILNAENICRRRAETANASMRFSATEEVNVFELQYDREAASE